MNTSRDKGFHISQVVNKSAENLSKAYLANDTYHQAIKESAKEMVKVGKGSHIYGGQYSSGSCWWQVAK